eukprot:TRINITY_DN7003_c1_g1_i1.p1 TRINITY_DN7003_c1_g1~~TRINITY_DN7003_c1_g1_i1.p1  ORF type:complete len:198 (-),score=25.08 TRINITY_DN7003_c1_g1_i1:525-1118(-)
MYSSMAMQTTTSFLTRRSLAPRIATSSSSSCRRPRGSVVVVLALENKNHNNNGIRINPAKKAVPNSNYVVPLDSSSCLTRPLAEIFRDLNKKVPDNIIKPDSNDIYMPWYHANRMLSFYAPGWCGEIRDILYSDKSVTVVYRVTVRGTDGEAYRESTGMASLSDGEIEDPVAAAEEIAFCRACARFGLGLYLYHETL